jgi:hypothetical protein
MSNIPGISVQTLNTVVSIEPAPSNAILVIGHVGATLPATVKPFSATTNGHILTFTSLSDALTQLGGRCDGTGWVAGAKDAGFGSVSPYDSKDNLLRALDLIYTANPSALVHAAVLDGVASPLTGTTALPDGAQRAMDTLLEYIDGRYIHIANVNPVAGGKSHAETSASPLEPYNSPRFYVTGMDLYRVWDATNNDGAQPPLTATQLAFMSTIKSADGLVLNCLGNFIHDFSNVVDSIDETDVVVEIGGQIWSAWYAGVLSTNSPGFTSNGYPALSIPVFHGEPYHFEWKTEANAAVGEGFIVTRFIDNAYEIIKGVTYSSDPGWSILTHRAVTNLMQLLIALQLRQFLKHRLTAGTLISVNFVLDALLREATETELITDTFGRVREHPEIVDALDVQFGFRTIKPVNKIFVTMVVS